MTFLIKERGMRKFKMGYLAYAEVRLLSRDAYEAIFRKGDRFEVTDGKGNIIEIVVD